MSQNKENVELSQFEENIHYHFQDISLLEEALSHSSYANEHSGEGYPCNERLEFLGDSVLSIVVSDFLFWRYPDLPEGELTKIRASTVCEKALFSYASEICLGDFLLLGHGEEHAGGRRRPSLLADAFEAVIAAIYIDGGMEPAKKHIMRFIPQDPAQKENVEFHDYKTKLQEIIQKNPDEQLKYILIGEEGPAHNRAFTVEVRLNSNVIGRGVGRSKKRAEQMAAREALQLMGELD